MAVLNPVKLIITNYPDGKEELLIAENNPEDINAGLREVPFSKELYIEREDFKENASNNFFRLSIGKEVRLKNAYIIKADSVLKDSQGKITQILCSYDSDSLSGTGTKGSLRKVKGTLHWVSIVHALKTEVRSYDRLFTDESPDSHKDKTFMDFINPSSLAITEAFVEPSLASAKKGDSFQFQRLGYFNVDDDTTLERIVFNKTVGLRDSWEKKKPTQKQVLETQTLQVPPINEIMRFGKKYTKLPIEKQELVKIKIQELATKISYNELAPFFGTALKKAGTRIVTIMSLGVLLKNNQEITPEIKEFVIKALEDKNELLVLEAKKITF
jgi:glutaminyl-tRNA synthetase